MAATEQINQEIDQLRKDMAGLRADLGSMVAAIKDLGAESSKAAFERVRETGDKARGQANAAQENLEQCIEERPITSVLVALGTGFVIGMLLGHRH